MLGVGPSSLALHEKSGWLLMAEPGINAVGVIDTRTAKVLGHVPAGWRPTRVAVHGDTVFVANARGLQTGPPSIKEGSVSVYSLPGVDSLAADTEYVMRANGLASRPDRPTAPAAAIRYVVLIVKGVRSYDEVLGDITRANNGPAMGAPLMAHLGTHGFADGERKRLSLQAVNVTPNHHAIARRWSFSDNFYADSENESEGRRWLDGGTVFGAAANRGPLWEHLTQHGISFRKFDAEATAGISDTARAARFIDDIESRFVKNGAELPRFLYLELPNDTIARSDPDRGFPYPESAAADNDNALGRVLEYLSRTKWWKEMAVFVTEAASNGFDHLDAHRTMLLCAGPWVKRDFVSHRNASFPALRKAILTIFHVPAMDLFDVSAADLSEIFTNEPDYSPYSAPPVDKRIYDPTVGPSQ
jgi:YVTN family beta-propeller protein